MRLKLSDLHLLALGAIVTLAFTPLHALLQQSSATPLTGAALVIAALVGVFAVLAPGYALTAALFPHAPLGLVKRMTYTLGFDFSLIALGGLALNLTPWGLSYTAWLLALGGVTLVASVVALLLLDGRPLTVEPLIGWALPGANHTQTVGNVRAGALIIVALLGIGGAMTLSVAGANQAQQSEQTAIGASLWLLPITQTGVGAQEQVGVRNLSANETTYRLTLTMNGQVVQVWPALDLRANQTWTATVNIASLAANGATGSAEQLTATLALGATPTTTYRQATAWVAAPAAATGAATMSATTTSSVSVAVKRRLAPSVRP